MSNRSRLLAGRHALWNPYHIPRSVLRAWWCADDSSAEIMVDDGGGLISSWKDRINKITCAGTTSQRPTRQAGGFNEESLGMKYDGAATGLLATGFSTFIPTVAAYSTLVVVADPGAATGLTETAFGYGGGGDGTLRKIARSNTGRLFAGAEGVGSGSGGPMTVVDPNTWTVPGVVVLEMNATAKLWRNGSLIGESAGAAMNTATTRLRIGAGTSAGVNLFWPGAVRHAFVFAGTISTALRQLIEGWCAWDSNLQALLPTDHPYKFSNQFSQQGVPTVNPDDPEVDDDTDLLSVPIQTEMAAWLARMDVQPADDIKLPVNGFVYRLKQYGIISKISELMFRGWDTRQANKEGLKAVVTDAICVFNNTIRDTAKFGVDAPQNANPGTADAWIDNGIRIVDMPGVTATNWGLIACCTSNDGLDGTETGWFSGVGDIGQILCSTGFRSKFFGPGAVSFGTSDPEGMHGGFLTSSTTCFTITGQGVTSTHSVTTGALPTAANSRWTTLRGGVTPSSYSSKRVLIDAVTHGFTQTDALNFYKAYGELKVLLGIADFVVTPEEPDGPGAFGPTAITSVTPSIAHGDAYDLTVCTIVQPPSANGVSGDDYNAYPCTDFISRAWGNPTTSTFTPARNGVFWGAMWDPRAHDITLKPNGPAPPPPRDNPLDGTEPKKEMRLSADGAGGLAGTNIRIDFDDQYQCVATLWCQIAQSAGYAARNDPDDPRGMGYLDYLEYFEGYNITPTVGSPGAAIGTVDPMTWLAAWTARDALALYPFNGFATMKNVCIFDPGRVADLTNFANRGFSVDLESHNHRDLFLCPRDGQNLFVKQHVWGSQIAHAKAFKYKWQCNVLHTGGAETGFSTVTAPLLMQCPTIDRYVITAVQKYEFPDIVTLMETQIGLAGSGSAIDWTKVEIAIGIGVGSSAMQQSVAALGREWLLDNEVRYLTIQKGGSPVGGVLSLRRNQVTATWTGLPLS